MKRKWTKSEDYPVMLNVVKQQQFNLLHRKYSIVLFFGINKYIKRIKTNTEIYF